MTVDKQPIIAGEIDLPPLFDPWLGSSYLPSNSESDLGRVHVMGESHYSRPDDPLAYLPDTDVTQRIIRDWAMVPSTGSGFFTRVASMIANTLPDNLDREAAWKQIAYSVFVQQLLPAPRQSPSPEQWADARRRFFGQLALTRPAVLVVLGRRQWEQLPWQAGARVKPFCFDVLPEAPVIDDAWVYPFWHKEQFWCTLAIKIAHPSAGWGNWNLANATKRVQSAIGCYSNVLEHCYDHFQGGGKRPFWP